ncbi:MAG: glycosyltransferase [Phycisphaerae bacterium]|nr:glycosyltransferase [Phycisphaerae bacterium]
MLRVLIQNRPDSMENPGGDTVQMDWTARYLRKLGHEATVSFDLTPDLAGYDLVHLFNLTRPFETLEQAENARRQAKPYVLSSVYWDLESAIPWRAYAFPGRWLRRLPAWSSRCVERARFRFQERRGRPTFRKLGFRDVQDIQDHIIRGARFVLPNSEAEKEHILARFGGACRGRIRVVMNGVSPVLPQRAATAALGPERAESPRRGAFLCAGALGPRKNQINLVRAFRLLPEERLLVLGGTAAGCGRYRRAVERAAGPNVEFPGRVPHERVGEFLRQAKAYVQPSYIETPGLAAMEAAAAGIPIVVSDVRPVREYFGSLAHYCDPNSPESIARACRAAGAAGACDGREFASRFAWDKVLAPMESIYAEIAAELTR